MSLVSLNVATDGLLSRGSLPAINIAVLGLLRSGAAPEPTQPVTTAGRRGAAAQWSAKTLGQIKREKERELKRLEKRARKRVVEIIGEATEPLDTRTITDFLKQEIEEVATQEWVTDPVLDYLVSRIRLDATRALIRRQEEEDDEESMLLLA
jgi:hypothetical protein